MEVRGTILPGLPDDAALIVFRKALAGRDDPEAEAPSDAHASDAFAQILGLSLVEQGNARPAGSVPVRAGPEAAGSDEPTGEEDGEPAAVPSWVARERRERERRLRAKQRLAAMWPLRAVSRRWREAVEEAASDHLFSVHESILDGASLDFTAFPDITNLEAMLFTAGLCRHRPEYPPAVRHLMFGFGTRACGSVSLLPVLHIAAAFPQLRELHLYGCVRIDRFDWLQLPQPTLGQLLGGERTELPAAQAAAAAAEARASAAAAASGAASAADASLSGAAAPRAAPPPPPPPPSPPPPEEQQAPHPSASHAPPSSRPTAAPVQPSFAAPPPAPPPLPPPVRPAAPLPFLRPPPPAPSEPPPEQQGPRVPAPHLTILTDRFNATVLRALPSVRLLSLQYRSIDNRGLLRLPALFPGLHFLKVPSGAGSRRGAALVTRGGLEALQRQMPALRVGTLDVLEG